MNNLLKYSVLFFALAGPVSSVPTEIEKNSSQKEEESKVQALLDLKKYYELLPQEIQKEICRSLSEDWSEGSYIENIQAFAKITPRKVTERPNATLIDSPTALHPFVNKDYCEIYGPYKPMFNRSSLYYNEKKNILEIATQNAPAPYSSSNYSTIINATFSYENNIILECIVSKLAELTPYFHYVHFDKTNNALTYLVKSQRSVLEPEISAVHEKPSHVKELKKKIKKILHISDKQTKPILKEKLVTLYNLELVHKPSFHPTDLSLLLAKSAAHYVLEEKNKLEKETLIQDLNNTCATLKNQLRKSNKERKKLLKETMKNSDLKKNYLRNYEHEQHTLALNILHLKKLLTKICLA